MLPHNQYTIELIARDKTAVHNLFINFVYIHEHWDLNEIPCRYIESRVTDVI